jgi:hypothetical protein
VIAGTSDWMVSVASGSSRCCTLTAGLGDLKHFQRTVLRGIHAYWVVTCLESLLDDVGWKPGEKRMKGIIIPCVVHGDLDEYLRQGLHSHCRHSDER